VIPVVVGSSPISHPTSPTHAGIHAPSRAARMRSR
jgi:hypothetical protein